MTVVLALTEPGSVQWKRRKGWLVGRFKVTFSARMSP